ncbi:MupG family TIM beta-alpha barrel fold protein [Companilactobacillus mishanensis]|uniref:DUF871 domain-containing protein n=1 Tax=Companilactobacillus mishanensis TaxID=2486008 RepID=A0ABW9P4P5_9LACO|nr:MupG family TIM beta-alpha barrel fold protein [Companilactobacillus mishanensis]MQS44210.1 DUF871 domain-containing protein [Companilactobacillus mishanensis]
MLGFSFYLTDPLDDKAENYFMNMSENGFKLVFTSAHIPEENHSQTSSKILQLYELTQKYNLQLMIDTDRDSMKYLPKNIFPGSGLRLDDGFSPIDISELSQNIPLALNASTLNKQLYNELVKQNFNQANVQAWHNYYPRPETGLDAAWLKQKNEWLHSIGFKTQAFIPGDMNLRGPLHDGLPTLESQRHQNLLASYIELKKLATDTVVIGDPALSTDMQSALHDYVQRKMIKLHLESFSDESVKSVICNSIMENRPDVARDVIRVNGSRQIIKDSVIDTTPISSKIRSPGSVTVDNSDYGRYEGELQIVKTELPEDPKVNVIAQVVQSDLCLLNSIGSSGLFYFSDQEEKD